MTTNTELNSLVIQTWLTEAKRETLCESLRESYYIAIPILYYYLFVLEKNDDSDVETSLTSSRIAWKSTFT